MDRLGSLSYAPNGVLLHLRYISPHKPALMNFTIPILFALCLFSVTHAQTTWQANLDSTIRFYQTTDFGIVLAGTEKSLYAIDGQSGERIWRRSTGKIQETAVTPVPQTDIILFTQ